MAQENKTISLEGLFPLTIESQYDPLLYREHPTVFTIEQNADGTFTIFGDSPWTMT